MKTRTPRVLLTTYRTLSNGRLEADAPILFSVPEDWLTQWLAANYEDDPAKAPLSAFLDAYTFDDALECAAQAKADGVFRYHSVARGS